MLALRLIFILIPLMFGGAQAEQVTPYPSRPVKIVVPWGAGGISDTLARRIGGELGKRLGQPFIVENRPGAAGNIGAATVARSKPDGYTLLLTVDTNITVNPLMYDKMDFDPIKDLTPVAMLSNMPMLLVTNPKVKANTISELIALAKSSKEPMLFGTSGPGSPASLLNELFKQKVGISMAQVPYQGNAPSVTSVVAGETQVLFAATSGVMPFLRNGKLNALSVVSQSRFPLLPNVPTMEEAGVPNLASEYWQLMLAPAGTPPEIVDKLNMEIARIIELDSVREVIALLGMTPIGTATPKQTAQRIVDEHGAWRELSKVVNLKSPS